MLRRSVVTQLRWSVAVVLALAVAACDATGSAPVTPTPADDPPSTTNPVTTTTVPAPTTTPAGDGCPSGEVMLADGLLLQEERPGSDGQRISAITWRTTGACGVVTISFTTEDGAPATTPPTLTARLLRPAGVLRVETAATTSTISDQLVESDLVQRLFVPVTDTGTRFIDFTLSEAVVARARTLTSPARIEIELQAGGLPDMGSPLVDERLVIVEPGSGATMGPVVDVTGYSIGEAETLTLSILSGGATIEEQVVELEPAVAQWRAFEIAIPMGDRPYDSMRVSTGDGTVIAGIPFSP